MRNCSAHERSVHFAGHVQIVSEFSPTRDQGCVLAAKRVAFAAKAEIGAIGVLRRVASLRTHGCLCSFSRDVTHTPGASIRKTRRPPIHTLQPFRVERSNWHPSGHVLALD